MGAYREKGRIRTRRATFRDGQEPGVPYSSDSTSPAAQTNASISSSVSLLEVATLYISEEMHLRRRTATLIAVGTVAGLSALCLWSQAPDSSLRVAGQNIFDLFNNATSLYMLPLGGLLSVLFAGWVLRGRTLQEEVTSRGRYGNALFPYYRVIVRFVAPVVIVLLFLSQIGVI